VRAANRELFLSLARELRTMSRPDLASRSGLSRASAYCLADELCRAGVLVEEGVGTSRGGRRPQLLRFRPEAWCAIGVEMGERDLQAVLTDLDGRILRRAVRVAPGTAPAQVVEATAALVADLCAAPGGGPSGRVLGLGFAAPGLVDMGSGTVRRAVGYDWFDVPLGDALRAATGLPVAVANRSKAAAVGELHSGAGAGTRHLVYVYAGRGIAAGVVVEGDLYTGANSSAGELGHITIVPDGDLCECGAHGCLHTVASGAAMLTRARAALRDDPAAGAALRAACGGDLERLSTVGLADAAAAGDGVAVALVQSAARYLGIATATLIDVLNPDRILLGGPLTRAGDVFLDTVRDEARRRSLAVPFGAVQILPAALGGDAGSVGAAALVLRQAAGLILPANGPGPAFL
jgi:glucokinase-like ROK family protein